MSLSAAPISSIDELMPFVELREVVFYRVLAERIEIADPKESSGEEPSDLLIKVDERHDQSRIEVRCKLTCSGRGGQYEVDAAARYEFEKPLDIPSAVIHEFITRVGVMAVYPYLRESLHASASKLRLEAPIVGLLKAGGVVLTPEKPA